MSELKPHRSLNVRGLYCPEPVFRTKIEVQSMKVGEILEVLADDPVAEIDIKNWVERTGQELLEFTKKEKELRFLIRKVK
ncbi:MAG: sulfurtransferase TusA family protein [Nitrososphaerales archaeon]